MFLQQTDVHNWAVLCRLPCLIGEPTWDYGVPFVSKLDNEMRRWDNEMRPWDNEMRQWDHEMRQWDHAMRQWDEAMRQWDEAMRQWDEAMRQWDEAMRSWDETMRSCDETMRWGDETMRWGDEIMRWDNEIMGWDNEMRRWDNEMRRWVCTTHACRSTLITGTVALIMKFWDRQSSEIALLTAYRYMLVCSRYRKTSNYRPRPSWCLTIISTGLATSN